MNEPIEDKALKPPGLLPKHTQSWLILGLAVLMVLIMWVTGAKKPPVKLNPGAPLVAPPAVAEVNEEKIAELQNRIQELQREQLVAQNALTQQSRMLAAGAPANAGASVPATDGEAPKDPMQAEKKKRGYLSLFASNVALSYRKNAAGPRPASEPVNSEPGMSGALPPGTETGALAEVLQAMQAPGSPLPPPSLPRVPAESDAEKKEQIHPAVAFSTRNAATGNSYVLFEGTILETVLVNRLDGTFTGPVECLLTTDTYSHDRQHLLIPAGSRILGESRKVEAFGESRLAVFFHRLIMPDGYSVSLDQSKGLNQTGDTGLRDQVNNHYARIFGVSLAIGALGAAAQAGTGIVLTQSGTDRLREGFGVSVAESAQQILEKFLNLLPTITIREGHRVKVYLSGDLLLPDYHNHKMPSDL